MITSSNRYRSSRWLRGSKWPKIINRHNKCVLVRKKPGVLIRSSAAKDFLPLFMTSFMDPAKTIAQNLKGLISSRYKEKGDHEMQYSRNPGAY